MNRTDLSQFFTDTVALPMSSTKHNQANNAIADYVDKLFTGVLFAADYGVICDAVRLLDGAITSGSTTFTSASANFTSDDVGKSIKISRALAGNDLKATITARNSSTSVTISTAATATVSSEMAYYGTDDTAAWQDCIDAAWAHPKKSIEIMFFGWSVIAGPIVTSMYGDGVEYRSQLVVPPTNIFAHDNRIITINGMVEQSMTPNAATVALNPPFVGSGWCSFTTSALEGAAVIGTNVLANTPWDTSRESTSHCYFRMKNMGILVPANAGTTGGTSGVGAGLCGVNGDKLTSLRLDNMMISIDYPAFKSSYPSYLHYGFSTSYQNGETSSGGNLVFCAGFFAGGLLGEHSAWGQISGQCCVHPMMRQFGRYGVHVQVLLQNWCKRGFAPVGITSDPTIIQLINIETFEGNDAYGNPAWYKNAGVGGLLYDPADRLRGYAYYKLNGTASISSAGSRVFGMYNSEGDLSTR